MRGDGSGIERADALAQLEGATEGLLHGHLLVEHEADEQGHRVAREERVGLGSPV